LTATILPHLSIIRAAQIVKLTKSMAGSLSAPFATSLPEKNFPTTTTFTTVTPMTLPSAVAEHGTVEERFTQTEKEPALPHRANPPGRAVANLRRKRIWTVYLEVRCPLLQGDLALIPHDNRDFGPVPAGEA